jgi:hypothetical protein
MQVPTWEYNFISLAVAPLKTTEFLGAPAGREFISTGFHAGFHFRLADCFTSTTRDGGAVLGQALAQSRCRFSPVRPCALPG